MSIKILIAEDDPKIANLIRIYLELEAFDANGHKALQLFDDVKPDLIVLDIMMPGIDGLEVLNLIRRLRDKLQNNDYTYLQTVWG